MFIWKSFPTKLAVSGAYRSVDVKVQKSRVATVLTLTDSKNKQLHAMLETLNFRIKEVRSKLDFSKRGNNCHSG